MTNVFTYESLAHAVSGSLGGAVSMALLYPLDQIRSIQQVEGFRQVSKKNKKFGVFGAVLDLLEEKGWQSLYQGHNSMQIALGTSNFVYFYCFNALKAAILHFKNDGKQLVLEPLQNLSLSTISGVLNVFMTAPFWVVNMRLKSKSSYKYNGILDCMSKIIQQEGIASLWNGTVASLLLVSNPVIHYFIYESMKTRLMFSRLKMKKGITALEYFFMGAFAKAVATVITYPLQVAQARTRAEESKVINKKIGVGQCMALIYKQQGVTGLYAGMEAKLTQSILTAAVSLLTYEQIVKLVFTFMYYKKK